MKLAIVRGAFLNPFESQLYAPLAERHDVTLVGAGWQFYKPAMSFPNVVIEKPRLWGQEFGGISSGAVVAANRLMSWTLGKSFGLWGLSRVLRGAEVIHAAEVFFTMSYQAFQVAQRTNVPLVVTVSENLPSMGETHPIRARRKRCVAHAADCLIAITESTRRMLILEGNKPEKIKIVPWVVDLNRFHASRISSSWARKLGLTEQDFVVLFVGRFIPEKGILELLATVPELLQRHPDRKLRFVFFGEGPLEHEIRGMANRYPKAIRIHSFVPYEELPDIHRLATVFVLPSKPGYKIAEQFGFVLIESMATGVPVLTTSAGSIRDVVGESALVVPPGNSTELLQALDQLIGSDELRHRLGAAGLERVRTHNDAALIAGRLELIYQDALEGRRRDAR